MLERYGLKDKSVDLVKRIKAATAGRILFLYLVVRSLASAASLRIGGHAEFVRPLINPMAQAADSVKHGAEAVEAQEMIKGNACAMENIGNFFAQNCFLASAGTLLIVATLNEYGYNTVTAADVAIYSAAIAVAAIVLGMAYTLWLDLKLSKLIRQKATQEEN